MNILITGSNGFIGKNLVAQLKNLKDVQLFLFDIHQELKELDEYCKITNYVFHLAGVNRPKENSDFEAGNVTFTSTLISYLKKHQNYCPIVMTSSIQATLDNHYGISKKKAEDHLFAYGQETGAKVLVYRLPNVFGKWCKPNYNSVVATFCNNISHDLPNQLDNPEKYMNFVYIDDVVSELIGSIQGKEHKYENYCEIPITYKVTLGELEKLIKSFAEHRNHLLIPDLSDDFSKKLFSTYLTYMELDAFSYALNMNIDERGSFTEFIRTPDRGQISVNISRPGIIKGNHWHNTKHEKFLVVSGSGVIRLRNIYSKEIIEYYVNEKRMEVIDIPAGYTHNIENTGQTDMVTIIWVNECFNPQNPDTFQMDVAIQKEINEEI